MPRVKGLGMPSKRKRATAKLQEVPEPDADEVDQGSACGPASPTHSSPPTVDSDEDLMPLERELATAEHDLALARAARWMRMADAKLKVAKRIYEAKMRRLDATADTGSVERPRTFTLACLGESVGGRLVSTEVQVSTENPGPEVQVSMQVLIQTHKV